MISCYSPHAKNVVVSIRMLCWAKLDWNLPISNITLCTEVFWAGLFTYFPLLPFSVIAWTKSKGPEKSWGEAALTGSKVTWYNPEGPAPLTFPISEITGLSSVYFCINMFNTMKSAYPSEKPKSCAGIHWTFNFKTHAGNTVIWTEMSTCGWLAYIYLGGFLAVVSVLSWPSQAITEN